MNRTLDRWGNPIRTALELNSNTAGEGRGCTIWSLTCSFAGACKLRCHPYERGSRTSRVPTQSVHRAPEVFEHVDQVDDDAHGPERLGHLSDDRDLVLVPIDQHHPLALMPRITCESFVEGFLDDGPWVALDAGPDRRRKGELFRDVQVHRGSSRMLDAVAVFPTADAAPFREESSADFLADIRRAGCETTHRDHTLDVYSLRHSFATVARRAKVLSDARDRLLGHRPKDTKAMHYEDEDVLLPLLVEEINKIPALLDINDLAAATPPDPTTGTAPPNHSFLVPVLVPPPVGPSGFATTSLMISAEEVRFELTEPLRVRRFSKPLP
jgi:hypothetical protein